MYNFTDYISNIAMAIASIWIVKRFWGTFFERKEHSFPSVAAWVLFFLFQIYVQTDAGNAHVSTIFLTAFFVLMIAVGGYDCAGKEKYFLLVIFCAVWILLEVFTFILISGIPLEQENLDILGTIISKILMVVLTYMVSVFWNQRDSGVLSGKFYLYLLFLPAGSIFVTLNLFYSSSSRLFSTVSVSILLMFNVAIFEIYSKMNELFLLEKEKTVYARQADFVSVSTAEQKRMMEEFHEEKHNLVNELIVLKNEVENNGKDSFVKSIDEIINNCYQTDTVSDCGNSTIDAIINFKYAVAREYGIRFSLKIFVPEELPIELCDMGIVLGNALDNAIEAVKECHTKEKVIDISIGAKKEALIIIIKNPYEHEIQKDNLGRILSSKKEKSRHGYGLKSIIRIAAKYQGDVVTDISENIFSLTVVMGFGEF